MRPRTYSGSQGEPTSAPMTQVAIPLPRSAAHPRCAAATTLSEACQGLVDDLHERYALPSVYLLVDGRLRCQAARGYFQVVDGFTAEAGLIGRVVASGEAAVIRDVRLDPDFIAAIPGLVAAATLPVRVRGEVVGAVAVESTSTLPDDVQEEIGAAADMLGRAIERFGGMPPVPLAQRLARIAVGLTALTDAGEIRARAVHGACQISGMSSAVLSEQGADGCWRVTTAAGPLAASLAEWTDEDHRVIAAWVKAGTSSHFPGGIAVPPGYEFLLRTEVRSLAVQPLVVAGAVTGLLTTADTRSVAHDPTVGAAVELLAAQTAASLANAQAMAELSRRAREDPLTGLRNAASFVEDLDGAGERTACLLVDVDHFKSVNDTFGHVAGDRLLRALADELRAQLRDDALLYRVGGDEMAVLLHADEGEAVVVAQRLVAAARRVRTTVSIGLALVGGLPPTVARLRADRALYLAKAQGRDRYVAAGPEV